MAVLSQMGERAASSSLTMMRQLYPREVASSLRACATRACDRGNEKFGGKHRNEVKLPRVRDSACARSSRVETRELESNSKARARARRKREKKGLLRAHIRYIYIYYVYISSEAKRIETLSEKHRMYLHS